MAMADSPPPLPSDIMDEILSRTSLETLGRCRLVSKGMKHTTYSSNLSKLLLERTETKSLILCQSKNQYHKDVLNYVCMKDPKTGIKQMKKQTCFPFFHSVSRRRLKILASTKCGILFCKTENYQNRQRCIEYFVCKLTTKQWGRIPSPDGVYCNEEAAVGMVVLGSRPILRYKIVLFRDIFSCTIFDSETWSWKQINYVKKSTCRPGCQYDDGFRKPVVSVCGKLYWIYDDRVFEFDPEVGERWELFPLPKKLNGMKGCKRMALVEYEGGLGLICILVKNECMELWVMEEVKDNNGSKKLWSNKKKVFLRRKGIINDDCYPLALANSDVAILMDGNSKLLFFHFENCRFSRVKMHDHQRLVHRDFFFLQSDSERVNFWFSWRCLRNFAVNAFALCLFLYTGLCMCW